MKNEEVCLLDVSEEQIEILKNIKKKYYVSNTKIPPKDNWKLKTPDEIWLDIVKQVMVVGGSPPANKLDADPQSQAILSYSALIEKNEEEIEKILLYALKKLGTRYWKKKSKALLRNFKIVKDHGGPKKLLEKISQVHGSDIDKVNYLLELNFGYIKAKGARDLLMGLGVVEDCIALDVRMNNILGKMGLRLDPYELMEREIIEKICKPLGLTGVEFDRLIYQNYDKIKKNV